MRKKLFFLFFYMMIFWLGLISSEGNNQENKENLAPTTDPLQIVRVRLSRQRRDIVDTALIELKPNLVNSDQNVLNRADRANIYLYRLRLLDQISMPQNRRRTRVDDDADDLVRQRQERQQRAQGLRIQQIPQEGNQFNASLE